MIHDSGCRPPCSDQYRLGKAHSHEFYGVEIEVEVPKDEFYREGDWSYEDGEGSPNEISDWIDEHYGKYVSCCDDCSIDYGFEINTRPFSFEWIKDPECPLKKMVDALIDIYECRSYKTTSCGMHVHIDLRCLSQLSRYKLQKLFFENASLIKLLSRRTDSNFRRWANISEEWDVKRAGLSPGAYRKKLWKASLKDTNFHDKPGGALNMHQYKTIEIRIFRGTLAWTGILMNMEIVHSMVHFCQTTNAKNINVENYLEFVYHNRVLYNNFFDWIKDKEVFAACASQFLNPLAV